MSALDELICVPPSKVADVWPMVKEHLFSAVRRTDLSHTADIEHDLLHGDGLLWLICDGKVIEAAGATLLVRTDKHLVCLITALGGSNREKWLPLLAQIEDWARAEGAALVRIMGRPGWGRVLKDYSISNVVLEKSLGRH
jgi:hypothetical protein